MNEGIIGCEESQAVTKEFRELGYDFFSCDLKECSGGHPEWHYKDDIFKVLSMDENKNIKFLGTHPVCKYLTNSGVGWLVRKKPTEGFVWSDKYQIYMNWARYGDMVKGACFFNDMIDAVKRIGKGYVENPIMHKYAKEIITEPYTQIIQPYQHGHLEKKATCLWIFGLPKLKETNNVYTEMMKLDYKDRAKIHYASPGPEREKLRSKTYTGIAKAMAEQWTK